MKIKIKVPSPGESITQVQLATWLVSDGDQVDKDQEVAEIDSDKATLAISAEESGKINLKVEEGETVDVGAVIAEIDTEAKGKTKEQEPKDTDKKDTKDEKDAEQDSEESSAQDKTGEEKGKKSTDEKEAKSDREEDHGNTPHFSPLARKLMQNKDVSEKEFIEWLKKQRVSREDIEAYVTAKGKEPGKQTLSSTQWGGTRETEHKNLSTLRLKLAERLVSVKNDTAMLTTFNEVDMTAIMDLRTRYKEKFKETHGINIGFMSFFTKAITITLGEFPQVNAMIDGKELIMHNYADIGIAVSTPKGLMVPVIRNAEKLSLAEIENAIKEMAEKARINRITLDDMKGGTFTITNGGVFGSMMSTPILNPPQSAILGMHNIQDRPVAVNGKVEIHPMMYLALSYDHRVVDGKDSVTFLVRVKELLENPIKMLLGGQDPEKALLDI